MYINLNKHSLHYIDNNFWIHTENYDSGIYAIEKNKSISINTILSCIYLEACKYEKVIYINYQYNNAITYGRIRK